MKGKSNYLSWMKQKKFISLCGDKMLTFILEESEEAV
jgi:hypothetical protein